MWNHPSINILQSIKIIKDRNLKLLKVISLFIHNFGWQRYCPICLNSSRKFLQFGRKLRIDARCPFCGSLERHRFVWIFIINHTNLFHCNSKKMLHVAPESFFVPKFEKWLGENYITADISGINVKVKMDITNIQYPDEYFDFIYCSHVLEHIQDDRKAVQEFYRILKCDGWAIITVPVYPGKTLEDSTIIRPNERLRYFGQEDHVRKYGDDFINILIENGFKVRVIRVNDIINRKKSIRMGLTPASGNIYYCEK